MDDKLYALFMNGNCHAVGSFNYIQQIIKDYVQGMDMYGHKSVDYRIERRYVG